MAREICEPLTAVVTETLPWACRIKEFGTSVSILGAKKAVGIAITTLCPDAISQGQPASVMATTITAAAATTTATTTAAAFSASTSAQSKDKERPLSSSSSASTTQRDEHGEVDAAVLDLDLLATSPPPLPSSSDTVSATVVAPSFTPECQKAKLHNETKMCVKEDEAGRLAELQDLLDPTGHVTHLVVMPSLLAVTLMNINAVWHPVITMGRFRSEIWDGKPIVGDAPPLFYEAIDHWTGAMLGAVSAEILMVKDVLEARYAAHGLNLDGVLHAFDWIQRAYEGQIADTSTLTSCVRTCRAYQGLRHGCKRDQNDEGWVPDPNHRFIREDIPFGLLVIAGVGELAGVDMPCTLDVIEWAQGLAEATWVRRVRLGKVDKKTGHSGDPTIRRIIAVDSRDVQTASRAPQRYGYGIKMTMRGKDEDIENVDAFYKMDKQQQQTQREMELDRLMIDHGYIMSQPSRPQQV